MISSLKMMRFHKTNKSRRAIKVKKWKQVIFLLHHHFSQTLSIKLLELILKTLPYMLVSENLGNVVNFLSHSSQLWSCHILSNFLRTLTLLTRISHKYITKQTFICHNSLLPFKLFRQTTNADLSKLQREISAMPCRLSDLASISFIGVTNSLDEQSVLN